MSDNPADTPAGSSAESGNGLDRTIWDPELEELDEPECWRLISDAGVARLAYSGQFGETVLPVVYKVRDGSLVFRVALGTVTDEDLRTGIRGASYRVAVEIDEIDMDAQEGWFVLVQGDADNLDSDEELAAAGWPVRPRPGAPREHLVRITPTVLNGRRLRRH
jgi:nitroimidazol reductase NimA-like FMN-containing flavoprotein (pyridoxamine 5'-phosphate oxidase superfamily)